MSKPPGNRTLTLEVVTARAKNTCPRHNRSEGYDGGVGGVEFRQPPTDHGTGVSAIFDDTCGNLIEIVAPEPTPKTPQS